MKVALVGLGLMGVPISERLLDAGYDLTVSNRTPGKQGDLVARGAAWAERAAGLLETCDVCITMVANDAALRAVALPPDGVLAGARPGAVLVDMSTVSVAGSQEVAAAAEAAGVEYLRAPVSGNPGVVRAGNLTIVVSGPAGTLERLRPLLETVGPHVYHVGEAEEARVVKLALNLMIAGTCELMAEALVLGELGGVAPDRLLEVMGNSAVGSPFVKYKTAPLLAGDYSATFTVSMMQKDLRLVRSLARESGVDLPLADDLDGLHQQTIDAGYADSDVMALLLALRERSGLPRPD